MSDPKIITVDVPEFGEMEIKIYNILGPDGHQSKLIVVDTHDSWCN